MLAYDIEIVPEGESKNMQPHSDTLLFEKVQCELVNEDGISIRIPEIYSALFIELFVLSTLWLPVFKQIEQYSDVVWEQFDTDRYSTWFTWEA